MAVQEEIRRLRTGRTICTNSPVGESECKRASGTNVVKRVEIEFRTIKANPERKLGSKIDNGKATTSWMTRWAGEVITRYTVGRDGKTAWERRRGTICTKEAVPFGEQVLYLPLRTAEIH